MAIVNVFYREPTGMLFREDLRYRTEDFVGKTSSRLMCTFNDARHVHSGHGWRPGTGIRIQFHQRHGDRVLFRRSFLFPVEEPSSTSPFQQT